MKYQSDNHELRIATAVVTNVFNGCIIRRYNNDNTVQQTIPVPVVVGTRGRVLRELENEETKNFKPPLIAVSRENFNVDHARMHSIYDHLKTVPSGYSDHKRRRGVPINIKFKVAGVAKFEADLDQMMTNVIPFFEPDVFVSWTHPKYPEIELKCQLVWSGDMSIQNPENIGPKDPEVWQFETSFVFKTWIFAGTTEVSDDTPSIKTINTSANDFFNIGSAGYGMDSVYAVPTDVSFSDFRSAANSGLIDSQLIETMSYPASATSQSINPALMCYPAQTSVGASTLKLVLIDEDRSIPEFDSSVFGFSDDSPTGSTNVWYVNAPISGDPTTISGQHAVSKWSDDMISLSVHSSFGLSSELVENSTQAKFEIDFNPHGDPISGAIHLEKSVDSITCASISGATFGSAISPNNDFALYQPDLTQLKPVFFYPNRYLLFWYKGRRYGMSVGGCIKSGTEQSISYGDSFPENPLDGSLHRMTALNDNSLYQYDAENDTWFEVCVTIRSAHHRTIIQLIGDVTLDPVLNKPVKRLDVGDTAYFNYPDYFEETTTRYLKLSVVGNISGNANLTVYIGDNESTGNYAVTTSESTIMIPLSLSGQISQVGVGLNSGDVSRLKLVTWEISD